jgi:alpha-tubulin suppressor-like RCC1 family protein
MLIFLHQKNFYISLIIIILSCHAQESFVYSVFSPSVFSNSEKCAIKKIDMSDVPYMNIVDVAAGKYHHLLLDTSGRAASFGFGDSGQLGAGKGITFSEKPVAVSYTSSIKITSIAVGGYHSLLIDESGSIYACGQNRFSTYALDFYLTTMNRSIGIHTIISRSIHSCTYSRSIKC